MTNWEYIREMVKNHEELDFSQFLCSFYELNCRDCPATDHCYLGHNGMLDWLEAERDEDEK